MTIKFGHPYQLSHRDNQNFLSFLPSVLSKVKQSGAPGVVRKIKFFALFLNVNFNRMYEGKWKFCIIVFVTFINNENKCINDEIFYMATLSCLIFTELALWTNSVVDWRLLFEERIANIGIPLHVLFFVCFDKFLRFFFFFMRSGFLGTSLLCTS